MSSISSTIICGSPLKLCNFFVPETNTTWSSKTLKVTFLNCLAKITQSTEPEKSEILKVIQSSPFLFSLRLKFEIMPPDKTGVPSTKLLRSLHREFTAFSKALYTHLEDGPKINRKLLFPR